MARTRSEEARAKALDAAREVLADQGVAGFTVDAVAHRSGVAKTTIYRHWPSGNHLLLDTVDCSIEPVPTPNTGNLRGDLIELYRQLMAMSADPGLRGLMLDLIAASTRDPELAQLKQEMINQRFHPTRTILELAQHRGELAEGIDLELASDLVEGLVFFRRMIRDVLVDGDELETVVDAAVAALRTLR